MKDLVSVNLLLTTNVVMKKVVNKMEVTEVRLRNLTTEGRMRAIGSIIFDHEFIIHNIRIISSDNGLCVAMPSNRASDGSFRDIAHPINTSTRSKLQDFVLAEYYRVIYELKENVEEVSI